MSQPPPPQNPWDGFTRRAATQKSIFQATLQGTKPHDEDVAIWLRGGAVFWDEQHLFLCWGLLLPKAFDFEEIEAFGIRGAIQESSDIARFKFGRIPVRHNERAITAVTAWNGFTGDTLFGFYPNENEFRSDAACRGWLLGQKPDLSDALSEMSDDTLMNILERKGI